MTTLQLNAELFRELDVIVTDEGMMEKAITSTHKRTTKVKTKDSAIDWNNLPELPEEFMQLRGMGHITKEDLANDERLAYIMGK